ncbi:hypothetical protein LX16_1420 [Stackebrandtia albiflava]|uniref:Uncharacterized protein n=1 Tax=Stackebrandtia albiflava TaxID=406432 RepID=A0A562VCU6_9ACTN|nr:hypothetical protein [Stackebrandtia albiflava]TWJ15706.1 hypothetical protein LX16_1420 [Stackebrandtia albiflava]
MVWLVCAGMIGAVGWAATSCLRDPVEQARRLTEAEATRLAEVRTTNQEAGPVAMRLALPDSLGGGGLEGHIDWRRHLVHAGADIEGSDATLVQAVPGLIASHTGDADPESGEVPDRGWTVRRMAAAEDPASVPPAQAATDIVLSALMALGSPQPADSGYLREKGVWLREAAVDGATVDVVRAPFLLQPDVPTGDADAASETAAVPEAVFWVDRESRLRRVQIDPGGHGLATVDFLLARSDTPEITPVDVLGGATGDPRELTDEEVARLAGLRAANSGRTAEVSLELPVSDDRVIRAEGYLDWRASLVYLAVDAPGEENDGLLFVLPTGAATLRQPVNGLPPSPPPTEGWTAQRWDDRIESGEAGDLDTLMYKLLVMGSAQNGPVEEVPDSARWLREDTRGGTTVDVYEFPLAGDPETEPGAAPYRYWVGRDDGLLHRIELRTTGLGMAHLDLTSKEVAPVTIPYGIVTALSS